MKLPAWSFSALTTFEQCPKKYYHLKVAKDFRDADSQASTDGKFIHDALYKRVIHNTPLPISLRHHEDICLKWIAADGEKNGEMKMALNSKFQPRDFFARDVWVRAVIDLLVTRGSLAIINDWKTGKKKEDFTQLKLSAAVLSQYMPEIEEFRLVFTWLRDRDMSVETVTKAQLKQVWIDFHSRVTTLNKAVKTTNFPANPTPLCGWCPVGSCPHYRDA